MFEKQQPSYVFKFQSYRLTKWLNCLWKTFLVFHIH